MLWKRLVTKHAVFLILVALTLALHGWYFLTTGPRTLNQDEAAILLNARFLSEAGKDEWGKSWPGTFTSFGDAKLPGYIWITALTGRLVGWNEVAVRLPSFLASLCLPFFVLLLSQALWPHKKTYWVSGLFMLTSPWTYHYGSLGFEAHFGLTLFVGALVLLFHRTPRWQTDLLAAGVMLFAGLTYNAPFLLLPFVAAALAFWRGPRQGRAYRASASLLIVFLAIFVFTWRATAQKQGIAFFQDATVLAEYPAYRAQFSGFLQKLLGNKWLYWARIGLTHFLQSFSWSFLVERGGANPWHTLPRTGHLSFLVPLAAFLGLGQLFRETLQSLAKKQSSLLAIWILFLGSLAPAVITTDAPHATRSLFFFVMLAVLAGWAVGDVYDQLCRFAAVSRLARIAQPAFVTLIVASFAVWWVPARSRWEQADSHWYLGLEAALLTPEVQAAPRVFIHDPEGVLYTRVANATQYSFLAFQRDIQRSAPAPTGLVRGERLGKYAFVFQPGDAQAPGLLLTQQDNRTWSTIEL